MKDLAAEFSCVGQTRRYQQKNEEKEKQLIKRNRGKIKQNKWRAKGTQWCALHIDLEWVVGLYITFGEWATRRWIEYNCVWEMESAEKKMFEDIGAKKMESRVNVLFIEYNNHFRTIVGCSNLLRVFKRLKRRWMAFATIFSPILLHLKGEICGTKELVKCFLRTTNPHSSIYSISVRKMKFSILDILEFAFHLFFLSTILLFFWSVSYNVFCRFVIASRMIRR